MHYGLHYFLFFLESSFNAIIVSPGRCVANMLQIVDKMILRTHLSVGNNLNIVLTHYANTYMSYVYLTICESIWEDNEKKELSFLVQQNKTCRKKI